MNVNVAAGRHSLDTRVHFGRKPWEAAGELRWLTSEERSRGLLSNQGHDDRIRVIDEWLAEKTDRPIDDLGLEGAAAKMYAEFLAERVNIDDVTKPPWAVLDEPLREWRQRAQPS